MYVPLYLLNQNLINQMEMNGTYETNLSVFCVCIQDEYTARSENK